MDLKKHARMTEDAEARILEEAVQTSYEKSGKSVSISADEISRETVKNKLHALKFPKTEKYPLKKRIQVQSYIDADKVTPSPAHNGLYQILLAMKYLRSSDEEWTVFVEALIS